MTESHEAQEANPAMSEVVQPQETLLTAIQKADAVEEASVNLFNALIEMDRQDLIKSMSGAPGPIRRKKKIASIRFQPARIKKIMQSDEEIGRMKDGVPAAIGKAMEHFAEQFLLACANEVKSKNGKTLNPKDMKAAMENNPSFSFLEKILGQVAAPPKKKKIDFPIKTSETKSTVSNALQ